MLEKRLLIITKANSRATVHRSAYLDYVEREFMGGSTERQRHRNRWVAQTIVAWHEWSTRSS